MTAASKLGSSTTAEQALRGASLAGKTAIVTGANSGIGSETVRVLALGGAHVIMGCWTVATGEETAKSIRATLPGSAGAIEGKTAQGSELQVGTNHVGHFLLTKLLRPLLESSAPARIVNVSSSLHGRGKGARLLQTLEGDPGFTRRKYVPFDAYGDSKLANVLFTRQLSKVLPPSVEAFALHPGVIPTNLTRSMGLKGAAFRLASKVVGRAFLKTIPQGAATTVYAATAPELAGQSGAYLADCAVVRPSRDGQDDALATKLWAVSEKLVANP